MDSTTERARRAFFRQFAWSGGHADVGASSTTPMHLRASSRDSSNRGNPKTSPRSVESSREGLLLGGAAAIALGAGFVAIRKRGALFPGVKHETESDPDYRGLRHGLQIQRESVLPGDRLLLIDDWIERGSQASAAQELVGACGGVLVGISVVVDQLTEQQREQLPPVTSLVTSAELPPSEGGNG